MCIMCFFFKQKTAYEMRISDWSSDVCSSDLLAQLRDALGGARLLRERLARRPDLPPLLARLLPGLDGHGALVDELARALIETPPVDATQGGYVAEGYDHALDALRETARDGRKAIDRKSTRLNSSH